MVKVNSVRPPIFEGDQTSCVCVRVCARVRVRVCPGMCIHMCTLQDLAALTPVTTYVVLSEAGEAIPNLDPFIGILVI